MNEPHVVREQPSGKGTGVWAGASLVAALLASACCLGPVVLSVVGLSALGISAAFEPMRPYFLGVTALFLGVGFYFAYFRQPSCASGEACVVQNPKLRHINRGLLWLATVVVVAVAFFPTYAELLLAGDTPLVMAHADGALSTVTLDIEGMACSACAISLERALRAVPGVQSAAVSYEEGRAIIAVDAASTPSIDSLVQAVEQTGYMTRPIRGDS